MAFIFEKLGICIAKEFKQGDDVIMITADLSADPVANYNKENKLASVMVEEKVWHRHVD